MSQLSSGPDVIVGYDGKVFGESADRAKKLAGELAATRDRIGGMIGVSEEELVRRKKARRSLLKGLQNKFGLSDKVMKELAEADGVHEPKHTGTFWGLVRLVTLNGWLIFPLRNRIKEDMLDFRKKSGVTRRLILVRSILSQ